MISETQSTLRQQKWFYTFFLVKVCFESYLNVLEFQQHGSETKQQTPLHSY